MAEKQPQATVRHENPLMPDERLRQLYTAMVQARMTEKHLNRRGRSITMSGEEAARASTVLSLGTGDLISDCSDSTGMRLLLGATVKELRSRAGTPAAKAAEVPVEGQHAFRLPLDRDVKDRLTTSLGAAAALKAQRGGRVLLVYTQAGEAGRGRWKKTLGVAGRQELPVIFVVLPTRRGSHSSDPGDLSLRSRGWGVPGFPVDGGDAIALYRVMQESLLRGRSDDGPALIECIPFQVAGGGRVRPDDAIARLEELLLAKGVASEPWMRETRLAFSRQLGRAGR